MTAMWCAWAGFGFQWGEKEAPIWGFFHDLVHSLFGMFLDWAVSRELQMTQMLRVSCLRQIHHALGMFCQNRHKSSHCTNESSKTSPQNREVFQPSFFLFMN